jgi:hypothetical protein
VRVLGSGAIETRRHRMRALDLSRAVWRKSRHSGINGCVEVAVVEHVIAVRDSKDRRGSVLVFTHDEWAAFIAGVRSGDFDLR